MQPVQRFLSPYLPAILGVGLVFGLLTPVQADSYVSVSGNKIVAGTGVRVRAEANKTAKEVDKLKFGTILTLKQRSDKQDSVGSQKAYWYNISSPSKGWVFGGLLQDVDAKKPEDTWLALARSKLGKADVILEPQQLGYSDAVEISEFLATAAEQAKNTEVKGELALDHWRAVQQAFYAMPSEKRLQPPYSTWFKSHGDKVFDHELAGGYYVTADTLWKLADQYKSANIGDVIAWQAANATLGGECEGFISCMSGRSQMQEGEYLRRYPHGKYVSKALSQVNEMLDYALKEVSGQKDELKEVDFADWSKILKPLAKSAALTQAQESLKRLRALKP